MNKKGIYSPTLVIFMIVILAYAISTVLNNEVNALAIAGDNQIKLINIYHQGEELQYFKDQCVSNSINKALVEYGKNGALKNLDCSSKWNSKCKPNKKDFIFYFDKKFKECLSKNELISDVDFSYSFSDSNLLGDAKKQITFNLDENLNKEKEIKLSGTYEINPSFIQKVNFDFNVLGSLYDEISKKLTCLKIEKIDSNLNDCIKEDKRFELNANRDAKGLIVFEVITNDKILKLDKNSKLIKDDLSIKFIVDPNKFN